MTERKNDLLDRELNGAPVMVAIAGSEHLMQFTIAAVIAYKQASGTSLFGPGESQKVDLRADPEKWLFCFWAGLHREDAEGNWTAPFTVAELKRLLKFRDMLKLDTAMWAAFAENMPAKDPDPKEPAPAESATPAPTEVPSLTSDGSGLALVDDLAYLTPSS